MNMSTEDGVVPYVLGGFSEDALTTVNHGTASREISKLFHAPKRGQHTGIKSCCLCSPQKFNKVLEHSDLVLTDIKHMDSDRHKELTRLPNVQILKNIRMAAKSERFHL